MKYLYLWPVCLGVMSFFVYYEKNQKYILAVILKGLASAVFVAFGVLSARMCANPSFSKMVTIGLILGLVADILLNLRYVFKTKGKLVFLVGILVFLAGHIMYLCALIPQSKYLFICVTVGVVLTALLLKWIFTQIEAAMAFKIFGVFYIGAITIMNCVALGNYIGSPTSGNLIFVIGAILFLISDIVLILNTFGKESKFSYRITNITLYYLGQLLIGLSLQYIAAMPI